MTTEAKRENVHSAEKNTQDLENNKKHNTSTSNAIGVLTAGGRSIVYQFTSFYLRNPLKLFRPARFDYTHYMRVILTGEDSNHQTDKRKGNVFINTKKYTSIMENSSLGILTKALNKYGWKVFPDRILPPLLVNSATGVVLYSTYLNCLTYFASNKFPTDNVPEIKYLHNHWIVFKSGLIAGFTQAIVSTPIDAIYTRSTTAEIFESLQKFNNLWSFGLNKLKEIGVIGCYSGFTLSMIKESLGFAIYFASFEFIKGQVSKYFIYTLENYRCLKYNVNKLICNNFSSSDEDNIAIKLTFISAKEEKWIPRAFIFVGGVSAAFLLQVVQYPFNKVQKVHFTRLEAFDIYNKSTLHQASLSKGLQRNSSNFKIKYSYSNHFRIYLHSYIDTFYHIKFIHQNINGLVKWLYRGFTRRTLATIPGTTAGLLLLDYMRSSLENDQINHLSTVLSPA